MELVPLRKTIHPLAVLLFSLLVIEAAAFAAPAFAAPAKEHGASFRKIWSAPNVEINNPQFSSDGSYIVFCRKPHSPDGHEAESYSPDELKKFAQKSKDDSRWEDPEVVCLSLQDNTIERIDYGWSPTFGSDNQTIFFVRQVKPISGFRVLAATQKGNDICSFNRRTREHKILAKPSEGYLDHPIPSSNGHMLAYSVCDAVNGAWGGTVGIGLIDFATGESSVPVKPAKHYKLFDLISQVCWCNSQLVAVRQTAKSEGLYLADSYDVDVINATKTIRTIYKSKNLGPAYIFEIEPNPDNTITITDDKQRLLVEPLSGRLLGPAKPAATPGLYSPDKSLCLRKAGKN